MSDFPFSQPTVRCRVLSYHVMLFFLTPITLPIDEEYTFPTCAAGEASPVARTLL